MQTTNATEKTLEIAAVALFVVGTGLAVVSMIQNPTALTAPRMELQRECEPNTELLNLYKQHKEVTSGIY